MFRIRFAGCFGPSVSHLAVHTRGFWWGTFRNVVTIASGDSGSQGANHVPTAPNATAPVERTGHRSAGERETLGSDPSSSLRLSGLSRRLASRSVITFRCSVYPYYVTSVRLCHPHQSPVPLIDAAHRHLSSAWPGEYGYGWQTAARRIRPVLDFIDIYATSIPAPSRHPTCPRWIGLLFSSWAAGESHRPRAVDMRSGIIGASRFCSTPPLWSRLIISSVPASHGQEGLGLRDFSKFLLFSAPLAPARMAKCCCPAACSPRR